MALEIDNVSVRFGGLAALSEVSLTAREGEITGLIGPNGAGKTTLFNVVTGMQRPEAGTVRLDGRELRGLSAYRRARLGLGRTFQRLELFGTMTVAENIGVAASIAQPWARGGPVEEDRRDPRGAAWAAGPDPGGERPRRHPADGDGRLVELARALAANPRVLLLDEPAAGQDTEETERFSEVLRELAGDGLAVLLVEHDMDLVMNVCDTVVVLDYGRVICTGTPAEVRADRRCRPHISARRRGRRQVPDHPLLEFRAVRAAYEEVEVLHGIDVTFEEGVVTAVLGANGAGKSTLLALAAGIMAPTEGEVRFAGEKVREGSTSRLARRGLCLVPEGRGVFPNLTVRENLWVMTHSGAGRKHVERRAFERFPRLAERRDQPAGTLSGGEQQMLALARAVATSPRLLMLDELSMGLAPLVVEELYNHVVQLAAEGITVVVVEQFARTALSVATSAVVMANGRIVQTGPAGDVEAVLHSAYLGGTELKPTASAACDPGSASNGASSGAI